MAYSDDMKELVNRADFMCYSDYVLSLCTQDWRKRCC